MDSSSIAAAPQVPCTPESTTAAKDCVLHNRLLKWRFYRLQTLFVQRLREAEVAGDAASSSAEPSQAGLPQKDLLSWYFDKMVDR